MSFDAHLDDPKELRLGDEKAVVRQVALIDIFRLTRLLDVVKDDLGLTRADVEGLDLSAKGLGLFLERLLKACVGSIDLEQDELKLEGPAYLVCRELGKLAKVSPEAVLFAPLDDLYRVAEAFWEVNANGPLGQRIRRTIGELMPRIQALMDVATLRFQQELIAARPFGGTTAGGTTTSSFPSTDASTGPSDTLSESSPPDASSPSSPPSGTSPDTRPQASEPEKTPSPESQA